MKVKYFALALAFLAFGACNQETDQKDKDNNSSGQSLAQAEALNENSYSIQKKGGEAKVYPLSQVDSRWWIGRSSLDKTKEALKLEIMDEDTEQTEMSTMGWGMWELPTEAPGTLVDVNDDFTAKYSWAGGKFVSFRTGSQLNLHMGKGGNVKSGKIMIKARKGSKAYSGEYQFLFIFVIDGAIWDSGTSSYIPDGEYTIIGNAIVNEYKPVLNSFRIIPSAEWVELNKTVTVDAEWYDDGAAFDWSQVKLISNTKGRSYSDDRNEGYFSWDASTRTLKSIKNAYNDDVYLKFQYGDTDMKTTCQIATGEGWNYTSFSLSPERLVMDQYDALYLYNESYAPTNFTWDWDALEIDPASDPEEAFYFDRKYHKLYNFSGKVGQTYNLRLRVRSNHSVGAPLEVFVVEQRSNSFKITYQQEGVYKPWDNGSPNGTCNYGMGLSLGVQTNPEDCYWNWSDVELIPGYDNTFSFSGVGGRDDHPKLMLKSSHDGTSYGVQVGFRLKYDHDQTSYIYVNHN